MPAATASNSPANVAGSNASAQANQTDVDGKPRLSNDPMRVDTGLGGAPIVDMGAYEFQAPPSCPADFNGVGGVTVADIFAFLSAWFSGSPAADFNGVGGLTVADIFAFLTQWFSGC